jgi:two-component system, LuxR family, response regulator FixJ
MSNRERDVLQGLVAGLANKQIAYDLGISPRTIEVYRANLMTKMQAASLSDLVRMALVAGILGPGPGGPNSVLKEMQPVWPARDPALIEPNQSG